MQVRTGIHESGSIDLKEAFEGGKRNLDEDGKRFFKLFDESTFEESRAAVRIMEMIANRQSKQSQEFLLIHSLCVLIHSDLKMLSWPNSPLLVMLQFVDPDMLIGGEEATDTPLHHLADLADPFDYSTHENQVILAKQFIEHGANVKAVSTPQGLTALHKACYAGNVTNLDFIELLLVEGADPNFQDHLGLTPLEYTTPYSPGAAKFLLNWPTTDANIMARSGESFLVRLRLLITTFSDGMDEIGLAGNLEIVPYQFLLQQWRDIEEMLMERV
jgi:hypothetical protein